MICNNCKKEINDGSFKCSYCEAYQTQLTTPIKKPSDNEDTTSIPTIILSFFFPLFGLVYGLIWKEDYPNKANACFKWAGIGAIPLTIIIAIIAISAKGGI